MYLIKPGIVKLAQFLHDIGVEIISTGGTMTAIREAGIPVTYVSADDWVSLKLWNWSC